MGTLGRIAHGYSEDALLRAADVMLKENKKLILCPRETPLSLVHVKNMELLLQAGALLLPPNPYFYAGAKTIEELADTVVARVLDHLGVKTPSPPAGPRTGLKSLESGFFRTSPPPRLSFCPQSSSFRLWHERRNGLLQLHRSKPAPFSCWRSGRIS